jgi:hypothetical protein
MAPSRIAAAFVSLESEPAAGIAGAGRVVGRAGDVSSGAGSETSGSDSQSFGRFLFGRFGFVGVRREEESSVPHARLACVHLQASFATALFR